MDSCGLVRPEDVFHSSPHRTVKAANYDARTDKSLGHRDHFSCSLYMVRDLLDEWSLGLPKGPEGHSNPRFQIPPTLDLLP